MEEIERKWILPRLPVEVEGQIPVPFERYFLFIDNGIELRIQRSDKRYEFERKVERNEFKRTTEGFEITEAEFNQLKKITIASIEREIYTIKSFLDISIKVYKGKFAGLIRAEVEFKSKEDASGYMPQAWFGKEITGTILSRDKNLLKLSPEEFKSLLEQYK